MDGLSFNPSSIDQLGIRDIVFQPTDPFWAAFADFLIEHSDYGFSRQRSVSFPKTLNTLCRSENSWAPCPGDVDLRNRKSRGKGFVLPAILFFFASFSIVSVDHKIENVVVLIGLVVSVLYFAQINQFDKDAKSVYEAIGPNYEKAKHHWLLPEDMWKNSTNKYRSGSPQVFERWFIFVDILKWKMRLNIS